MSLDDIAADTVSDIRRQYIEKLNKLKARERRAKESVNEANLLRAQAQRECAKLRDLNNWLVAENDYLKQELEELHASMWTRDINLLTSNDLDMTDFATAYLGGWD